MEVLSRLLPMSTDAGGPGCERVTEGPLDEPVAALTSLSFVVAALVIALRARRGAAAVGTGTGTGRAERGHRAGVGTADVLGYAVLVAGVGIGSFVQHGPDPAWSDVAHDLPLLATLAFLGADAAADLTGRARAGWWWSVPVLALLPVVVLRPHAGDLAQVGVAGVAVALTVLRAARHPELRRAVGGAVGLLVAGATVGTSSRAGGPWCDPTSVWQGHGVWHVLAAAALALLAPTVGSRRSWRATVG